MITTTITLTEESLGAMQEALFATEAGRPRALQIAAVKLRNYLVAVAGAALLSVFVWVLVPRIFDVLMLAVAAIFLVLAFPLYRWYAFKVVRRSQAKAVRAAVEEQRALGIETLTYEFDTTGVTIRCPFSTVVLPWSSMLGWVANGTYLFVVRRDNKGLVVDTRALAPGELQELKGLMAAAGVQELH